MRNSTKEIEKIIKEAVIEELEALKMNSGWVEGDYIGTINARLRALKGQPEHRCHPGIDCDEEKKQLRRELRRAKREIDWQIPVSRRGDSIQKGI